MVTNTMKKAKIQTDDPPLPSLPPQIIDEILTWVPTKSLMQFRCVSKHFSTLLSDLTFLHKHLIHTNQCDEANPSVILQTKCLKEFYFIPNSSFDKVVKLDTSYLEKFPQIVGSCNGLVCLSHEPYPKGGFTISLWNPTTKEYKLLPKPRFTKPPFAVEHSNFPSVGSLGFGFVPIVNDYKVVRLAPVEYRGMRFVVEVYSLKTNLWRTVGAFRNYISNVSSRTIMNGVVHWVASPGASMKLKFILSFDMGDERLLRIPVPEIIDSSYIENLFLREFRGCLSLFGINAEQDIDVWVMLKYRVKQSWTRLFRVEHNPVVYSPIDFFRDCEILLWKSDCTLVSYNPKSRRTQNLRIPELRKVLPMDAVPYVESHVRLTTSNQAVEGQQEGIVEV